MTQWPSKHISKTLHAAIAVTLIVMIVGSVPAAGERQSFVYLMKQDQLFGARIKGATLDPLQKIDTSGWDGRLAVSNGWMYRMTDGQLWVRPQRGLQPLGSGYYAAGGGWNGELAVSNFYVYLMKDDNLYAAHISKLGELRLIATRGWRGKLAVSNGWIYLMKDGILYGAPINGLDYRGGLQEITRGGWTGEFAVSDGRVYLMHSGNLFGAPLNGLDYSSVLDGITTGGWTGALAVESFEIASGGGNPGGGVGGNPGGSGTGGGGTPPPTVVRKRSEVFSCGSISPCGSSSNRVNIVRGDITISHGSLHPEWVNETLLLKPDGFHIAYQFKASGSYTIQPGQYIHEVRRSNQAGSWDVGSTLEYYDSVGGLRAVTGDPIENGSFEYIPGESPIPYWSLESWQGRGRASIFSGNAREGVASALLVNQAVDDTRLLQTVSVKPNTKYLLSGWVRTEDVRIVETGGNVGANLAIEGSFEHSNSLTGTQAWTRLELNFDSGSRTQIRIGPRLGHHGSTCVGKAWFDDLNLVEATGPPGPVILNDTPTLNTGWTTNALAEAPGGRYFATFNSAEGASSKAAWTGTAQQGTSYNVEVFIPRRGVSQRTTHAVYRIFHIGFIGVTERTVNQDVASSQWVTLGKFLFQGSYSVELTNETGEPDRTRSVAAAAVRLTPTP